MARKNNRKPSCCGSKSSSWHTIATIIVIAIIAVASWADSRKQSASGESASNAELLNVGTNPALPSVEKAYTGMLISFNPREHIPNWASWELTAEETQGKAPRTNKFSADPTVEGCAETWDYSYSGYDRGHMVPAGDMKWSELAMQETFLLTNICPQDKALNTGAWRTLEEKCRQWARAVGRIYIVCGPVIDGKPVERIGETGVYVPRKFFKAIIAPDHNPAMGIGFIMPNSKVAGGMQPCAVSIDSIESLTGHDFFAALPDDVEADIESQCNFNRWATLRPSKR